MQGYTNISFSYITEQTQIPYTTGTRVHKFTKKSSNYLQILELLHKVVQIWQPTQQVIRAQRTSVVFGGRGKQTEMTLFTE
jgi:hypothetical protein